MYSLNSPIISIGAQKRVTFKIPDNAFQPAARIMQSLSVKLVGAQRTAYHRAPMDPCTTKAAPLGLLSDILTPSVVTH